MTTSQAPQLALFLLSIGILVWANIIVCKSSKAVKEAQIKTESAKEEIETLNDNLKARHERISWLEDENRKRDIVICELKKQIPSFTHPRRFEIKEAPNEFYICAYYPSRQGMPEVMLPIKSFPHEDDPDFAHREAQELLEHLNEK